MYRDPQVTFQVVESPNQIATVIGEVHGMVPILGERRLYDVLSAAGAGGGGPASTTIITGGRWVATLGQPRYHDPSLWHGAANRRRPRNRPCEE